MNSENIEKLKDELTRLIGGACDGVLTEEQRLRLNELLMHKQALRTHYLKYIAIHSALSTTAGSQATRGVDELRDRFSTVKALRNSGPLARSTWRVIGSAVARAAAILLVLAPPAYFAGKWIATSDHSTEPSPVAVNPVVAEGQASETILVVDQGNARVIRVSAEARWPNPNESFTIDSVIRPGGRVRLLEGEIELEYESGVKLLLIGPVDFVLQGIGGELQRGGLMASVPQAGHGFTIATPNGKVVDLGTEFGVMVDDFGVSEVSVFEGKVEAFPATSVTPGDGKIRLTKGSALQWNDGMLKSLEADPRRLPVTLASFTRPNANQLATDELFWDDFRRADLDAQRWLTLGDARTTEAGLLLEGNSDGKNVPYLITKKQFDPTLGAVTVVCDVRFPLLSRTDVPSFSILTRSTADRASMDRAWRDLLSTCVRCNFRSAIDEFDGLLESSTKYERDRELTSLSWRGFRRPRQNVIYRLVMRDDGVNVSFTVTEIDNPSVTKTVTCRSLFQGYENHIALEGWDQGDVIVEKVHIYQELASAQPAEHFARFSFTAQNHVRQTLELSENPLQTRIPGEASLLVEDRFNDNLLNSRLWSVLGDVQVVDGKVSLGPSKLDNHIDTFHPRPYLLTRQKFNPVSGKVFALGKIEFDGNFLQGYGGSFAVMSRCEGRYGLGPEWAVSALGTGIRCNLWPAAPRADRNLEVQEKTTATTLTFLEGGSLPINPRSRTYYFLMEDSGQEAAITFQDAEDPTIVGTVRHETTSDAPRDGLIGFESTWGSSILLDDVRIYAIKSSADKE
jgi:hypothetical protein